MLYDLTTEIGKSRLRKRVSDAIDKGALVDFTEKKPLTTPPQQNYLHLLLGYFALETGNALDYVKRTYFKAHCSPDIFIVEQYDEILGKSTKSLRSVTDCTTEEISIAIERFRNWSSSTAEIYLPDANEDKFLNEIRYEMDSKRRYL